MSAEDPRVLRCISICKRLPRRCGVDGGPGGAEGRPFGPDKSLFVGFGVQKIRKDCRLHPKTLDKSKKRTFLAEKVRGHWTLHGDNRFPVVDRQKYVPPADILQRSLFFWVTIGQVKCNVQHVTWRCRRTTRRVSHNKNEMVAHGLKIHSTKIFDGRAMRSLKGTAMTSKSCVVTWVTCTIHVNGHLLTILPPVLAVVVR